MYLRIILQLIIILSMTMIITDILLLILGLVLIVKGADWLTTGASDVARKFNVSELIIGLTIVGIGTSTPELVVSSISAIDGLSEIAVGNVVGSNIANVLLILGVTAMIKPFAVDRQVVGKDIPWSILAATLLFIVASGTIISNQETNIISRQSGLVLLCIMITFLYYTLLVAKKNPSSQDTSNEQANIKPQPIWKSILFIIIGLAGLIFGGDFFVDSASNIALALGVSQSIVGLTIVAIGTSTPELATSVAAALKGKTDMAIGNVVGSSIFNIFFILGICATITPLEMGGITTIDLIVQLACSLLIWFFARTSYKISRAEGVLLTMAYIGYVAYLILNQ